MSNNSIKWEVEFCGLCKHTGWIGHNGVAHATMISRVCDDGSVLRIHASCKDHVRLAVWTEFRNDSELASFIVDRLGLR